MLCSGDIGLRKGPLPQNFFYLNIVGLCLFAEMSTKNCHETMVVFMWPVAGLSQRFAREQNWFGQAVTRSSKLFDIPAAAAA